MPIPIFANAAAARATILRRVPLEEGALPPEALERNRAIYGEPLTPAQAGERIISSVRTRGDEGLREWTERLDGVALEHLELPQERLAQAAAELEPELLAALLLAAGEIERFHCRQVRNSWTEFGAEGALGQLVVPLQRVGLYVPGG